MVTCLPTDCFIMILQDKNLAQHVGLVQSRFYIYNDMLFPKNEFNLPLLGHKKIHLSIHLGLYCIYCVRLSALVYYEFICCIFPQMLLLYLSAALALYIGYNVCSHLLLKGMTSEELLSLSGSSSYFPYTKFLNILKELKTFLVTCFTCGNNQNDFKLDLHLDRDRL